MALANPSEVVGEDSHDDLLLEERAIKGEGLVFPSLSANVHSVLLGELISETKQHGQTLWSQRDVSSDSNAMESLCVTRDIYRFILKFSLK